MKITVNGTQHEVSVPVKRSDILKAVASLPLIGGLLSSPVSTAVEQATESGDTEWYAFGLTEDNLIIQGLRRTGWPTANDLRSAAQAGLDRFEVFLGNKIIYQAPTEFGKIPAGWNSLEHSGWISR